MLLQLLSLSDFSFDPLLLKLLLFLGNLSVDDVGSDDKEQEQNEESDEDEDPNWCGCALDNFRVVSSVVLA